MRPSSSGRTTCIARSLAVSPCESARHAASGRPPWSSWITGASVPANGFSFSSRPSRPSAKPVRLRIAAGGWRSSTARTKRTQGCSLRVETRIGIGGEALPLDFGDQRLERRRARPFERGAVEEDRDCWPSLGGRSSTMPCAGCQRPKRGNGFGSGSRLPPPCGEGSGGVEARLPVGLRLRHRRATPPCPSPQGGGTDCNAEAAGSHPRSPAHPRRTARAAGPTSPARSSSDRAGSDRGWRRPAGTRPRTPCIASAVSWSTPYCQ